MTFGGIDEIMKICGITGGVGAGKSRVLKLIEEMTDCIIIRSDELAKSLEKKQEMCFLPLVKLLGEGILGSDGEIDPKKMAAEIFKAGAEDKLEAVNKIVHPAVKERILALIDEAKRENEVSYFFIEAALLIEEGYEKIVDEMWYVYAPKEIRAERLKATRGYSDEKIYEIMNNQLTEEEFRAHCDVVIDNAEDIDKTKEQLKQILGMRY